MSCHVMDIELTKDVEVNLAANVSCPSRDATSTLQLAQDIELCKCKRMLRIKDLALCNTADMHYNGSFLLC